MQELIITAVGPDRPGLVDAITGRLLQLGVNVADSRMVNLRGRFALILLAEAQADQASPVRDALGQLAGDLSMSIEVSPDTPAPALRPGGVPYRLRTYAMDQPGIVHRITHLLNKYQVNIEELATRLQPGSMTGTPLFTMQITMTLPPQVRINALRGELEQLCDDLNCDVEIEPA